MSDFSAFELSALSLNLQMGAVLQCCFRRRSEPDPDQQGEILPLSTASPEDTGRGDAELG